MGYFGYFFLMWGMSYPIKLNPYKVAGAGLFFIGFEAVLTTIALVNQNGLNDVWSVAQVGLGGGYLGGGLTWLGERTVGEMGSAFVYLLLALVGVILMAGVRRQDVREWVMLRVERARQRQTEEAVEEIPANPVSMRPRIVREAEVVEPSSTPQISEAERIEQIRLRHQEMRAQQQPARLREGNGRGAASRQAAQVDAASVISQETVPAIIENYAETQWELPDFQQMLEPGLTPESAEEVVQEQWYIIEQTLESFGAPGRVVDVRTGPTVTMFGVEPQYLESRTGRRTKVKVSKIAGLADDLSLALAAKSVRIQAPVPGKGYIGIEVPSANKVVVSLRDTMESTGFQRITQKSPLAVGLGQDVSGNSISADLAKMPHLLIAGATGSGKSVCVNGIIACLLLQNTPSDLRFVMVDPKRVELTGYNGIPHLAAPVVVEMDKVVGVLQWALREMDHRYQAFAKLGARNISTYNDKAAKEGKDRLPYIVIIIDELADLMMTAPEDTERALARLAQMARATGIHMIVATQRPSVDVVTGLIKANFPARIAFAVSSATDSRVILDQTGAERLLGMGDMLFQKPDAPAPLRMQGCYVSDEELNKLIGYWKTARRFRKFTSADAERKPTIAEPDHLRRPATSDPLAVTGQQSNGVAEKPSTPSKNRRSANVQDNPTPEILNGVQEPLRAPKPDITPAPHASPQPLWEHLAEQESKKEANQVDELWTETVAYVRKVNKASTSMLQRRFQIGYTRAARIIDAMEEAGIIGMPTGTSKAREVLPFSEND
jgi:S-DNA-T family DNA segregation ATPase FtsK/SpoIIIE